MMNVAYKPFDNKLVRQAINYCIDAPAIVKNIFDGIGYTVDGPVGARVIGADPKLKRYPYDPQKAKATFGASRLSKRLRRTALLFRRPLSQRPRSLPSGRRPDGQRRF